MAILQRQRLCLGLSLASTSHAFDGRKPWYWTKTRYADASIMRHPYLGGASGLSRIGRLMGHSRWIAMPSLDDLSFGLTITSNEPARRCTTARVSVRCAL